MKPRLKRESPVCLAAERGETERYLNSKVTGAANKARYTLRRHGGAS